MSGTDPKFIWKRSGTAILGFQGGLTRAAFNNIRDEDEEILMKRPLLLDLIKAKTFVDGECDETGRMNEVLRSEPFDMCVLTLCGKKSFII